jgi:hypothetical protein
MIKRAPPFEIRARPKMVRYCGDDNCAICLEPLHNVKQDGSHNKTSSWVKQLPCMHQFHQHCIVRWDKKKTCPLCRKEYKYHVFHKPAFVARWWHDNEFREKEYFGPDTVEDYRQYWEDVKIFHLIDVRRQRPAEDKPKTFYYKALRDLKREVRRRRRLATASGSTEEDIHALQNILRILNINLALRAINNNDDDVEGLSLPLLRVPSSPLDIAALGSASLLVDVDAASIPEFDQPPQFLFDINSSSAIPPPLQIPPPLLAPPVVDLFGDMSMVEPISLFNGNFDDDDEENRVDDDDDDDEL